MVQLLQRYNTEPKLRTEIEQLIDSSSAPASAVNAAVPHSLCCLTMLRQSRGKKRQLHAQVIKMTGRKTKKGLCSLDGDKSVMMEQGKRKKWNRISGKMTEKKMRVRKKHSWGQRFLFFF